MMDMALDNLSGVEEALVVTNVDNAASLNGATVMLGVHHVADEISVAAGRAVTALTALSYFVPYLPMKRSEAVSASAPRPAAPAAAAADRRRRSTLATPDEQRYPAHGESLLVTSNVTEDTPPGPHPPSSSIARRSARWVCPGAAMTGRT